MKSILTLDHRFVSFTTTLLSALACQDRLEVMADPIAIGAAGTEPTTENGGASGSGSPDSEQGGAGGSVSPNGEQAGASGSEHRDGGTGDTGTGSEPCACASSDAFMPVGCEFTRGYGTVQNIPASPKISASGDSVAFNFCFQNADCTTFHWKLGEGIHALPQSSSTWFRGMNADGTRLLLSPRAPLGSTLLTDPEGTTTVSMTLQDNPRPLLSANGTVIGVAIDGTGAAQLMRRAPDGELTPVATLPVVPVALTTTADGSTVAGHWLENGAEVPFRWNADGLVIGIEGLPETAGGATIHALSADGSTLGGVTMQGGTPTSVYRWTAESGYEEIGAAIAEFPGTTPGHMAFNANGSLWGASVNGLGAVRWTTGTGSLPLLPQVPYNHFLAMSDDANVMVTGVGDDHIVWTEAAGARSIRSTLQAAGVDFTGWSFELYEWRAPFTLSADGRVAIGGAFCGGEETLFRVVLPE